MIFDKVIEMMHEQMENGIYDFYHDSNMEPTRNANNYIAGQELNIILKDNVKTTCCIKGFKFLKSKWWYQCYIRGISIIVEEKQLSPL